MLRHHGCDMTLARPKTSGQTWQNRFVEPKAKALVFVRWNSWDRGDTPVRCLEGQGSDVTLAARVPWLSVASQAMMRRFTFWLFELGPQRPLNAADRTTDRLRLDHRCRNGAEGSLFLCRAAAFRANQQTSPSPSFAGLRPATRCAGIRLRYVDRHRGRDGRGLKTQKVRRLDHG